MLHLKQDILDSPPLIGQFVFNSFEFKFKPISLPLISENDIRDNDLLKELKEYFDACFSGMILFPSS